MLPVNSAFALCIACLIQLPSPGFAQDTPVKPHIPLEKTIGQVTPTGPVPSLYVVNADGATLADGKLTLTGVSPNTIVFADRPVRSAGHLITAQALEQWDVGNNNFAIDPPNATISMLGGVGSDVSDAVVVLTKPVLDGTTLTFEVEVLEGSLVGVGPAALFIDNHGGGGSRGGGGRASGEHMGDARGGSYHHAPDYHGAWYGAGGAVAGAAVGAAVGTAAANSYGGYGGNYGYPPYCGYAPYPPCY